MADNKSVMKRKLTGAFFQSLDGVIQAPGGPEEDRSDGFPFSGWFWPFADESMGKPMGKILHEQESSRPLVKSKDAVANLVVGPLEAAR
jgi:hypothetical protein